jgi:hypothetical protein
MIDTLEAIPTVDDAMAISTEDNYLGSGCYRTVYRKKGSRWVIKVDNEDGAVNRKEYETYLQFRPSLTNNVYFPEMHLLDNGVLVAEFIDGVCGNMRCWNYSNGVIGCKQNCQEECWAQRIEYLANQIQDLHYQNIRILPNGDIYIIDLGEGPREAKKEISEEV